LRLSAWCTVAVLVGTLVLLDASRAGALGESFSMTPGSGPAGTVVSVSGSGCAPGLTLNPSGDYVRVTSTMPHSAQFAVAANGSWHGAFTVPAGAPPLPSVVTAVCFTDGLPSLTTQYLPNTFQVTAPPPSTTTLPGVTISPTTAAPATSPPGSQPHSTTTVPHSTPSTPGNGVTPPGAQPPSPHAGGRGGTGKGTAPTTVGLDGSRTTKRGARATNVDPASLTTGALEASGFGDAHATDPGWLSWMRWVLIVLVAAAIAASIWWRRWLRRTEGEPGAEGA
jgi:hypothetical protein